MDDCGNIFITEGRVQQTFRLPQMHGKTTLAGSSDAFVSIFDSAETCSVVLIGRARWSICNLYCFGQQRVVYVAGFTGNGFSVTADAWQSSTVVIHLMPS
jgi:hypothetical protein